MHLDKDLAVRMIHQAKQFRATSVILHDKIHNAKEHDFFAPYATVCTLTVELYFKSVIYIETLRPPLKSHKIDGLVVYLPESTQAAIEKLYVENSPETRIPLRELLRKSSRAFEIYRYFYEQSELGGYYLTYEIIDATVAYLRQTQPKLMTLADNLAINLLDTPRK